MSRFIESEKLQISNQHAKTQRGIRKAPHEAGGEHRPGPAMPLYDIFLLLNRLFHDSSHCFCILSSYNTRRRPPRHRGDSAHHRTGLYHLKISFTVRSVDPYGTRSGIQCAGSLSSLVSGAPPPSDSNLALSNPFSSLAPYGSFIISPGFQSPSLCFPQSGGSQCAGFEP